MGKNPNLYDDLATIRTAVERISGIDASVAALAALGRVEGMLRIKRAWQEEPHPLLKMQSMGKLKKFANEISAAQMLLDLYNTVNTTNTGSPQSSDARIALARVYTFLCNEGHRDIAPPVAAYGALQQTEEVSLLIDAAHALVTCDQYFTRCKNEKHTVTDCELALSITRQAVGHAADVVMKHLEDKGVKMMRLEDLNPFRSAEEGLNADAVIDAQADYNTVGGRIPPLESSRRRRAIIAAKEKYRQYLEYLRDRGGKADIVDLASVWHNSEEVRVVLRTYGFTREEDGVIYLTTVIPGGGGGIRIQCVQSGACHLFMDGVCDGEEGTCS